MMSAFLLQNVNRSTSTLLTKLSRSIQSTCNAEISKNEITDDRPMIMKNPFEKERQLCILCKLQIEPDYKNVRLLSQFQSTYTGRIYGKHITGLCSGKQKKVEAEIFKAQNAGMMGYYTKDPKYARDPKLFDPNNPFRAHKY